MADVVRLPTAAAEPVVNARRPGRPKGCALLSTKRREKEWEKECKKAWEIRNVTEFIQALRNVAHAGQHIRGMVYALHRDGEWEVGTAGLVDELALEELEDSRDWLLGIAKRGGLQENDTPHA